MRLSAGIPRAMILKLISRPEGVSAKDLPYGRTTAARNFKHLKAEGLVFPAGHHWDLRYFDTPEKADAYVPRPIDPMRGVTKKTKPIPKQGPVPIRIHKPVRQGWGKDDPMHITPDTKYTIAPTPPRALRSNTFLQYA